MKRGPGPSSKRTSSVLRTNVAFTIMYCLCRPSFDGPFKEYKVGKVTKKKLQIYFASLQTFEKM